MRALALTVALLACGNSALFAPSEVEAARKKPHPVKPPVVCTADYVVEVTPATVQLEGLGATDSLFASVTHCGVETPQVFVTWSVVTGGVISSIGSTAKRVQILSTGLGATYVRATSDGGGMDSAFVTVSPPPVWSCAGTHIFPGDEWSTAINAAPTGATICIHTGTHFKARNVNIKTGQYYYCEPGAIADGGDTVQYALKATGGVVPGVVVRNCKFQHYDPPLVGSDAHATLQVNNAQGIWLDSVEVSWSTRLGVKMGFDGSKLTNSYIHDNELMGVGYFGKGTAGANRINDSLLIDNNLFERNPINTVSSPGISASAAHLKIFYCKDCRVTNNTFRDGGNKGLWFDTDVYGFTVSNNVFTGMQQQAFWQEAGFGGRFTGNTISDCGGIGIMVTNSKTVEIDNNTISGCGDDPILGRQDTKDAGSNYTQDLDDFDGDLGLKFLGLNVHDNNVTFSAGRVGVRNSAIVGATSDSVYNAGKQIFEDNHYTTALPNPFTWQGADRSWAFWQALGFDSPGGTLGP